ncbi:MAG: TetR/AcrR family transcriptional regulator [Clostridia bacterium]|nr:TetR/AcrR family transcriptional regulator [Clostridia bacterium]MBR3845564.1 TetR/AcrR family transcriptional regulator [Clostridia bacterium]
MDNKFARKTIKERLILAGIDEIGNCGVAGFSLRQVAVACNVSCATPYNYFKNKEGFVLEIIQYIKHQWSLLKGEINKLYRNDEKQLLIELCVFYIKFLVGNPNYRSIIMLDNIEVDDESYQDIESARNFIELELEHYMKINNVSARESRRKSFVIRAIVFEATLLLERGDLENTPENFDFIRYCIAKELALV